MDETENPTNDDIPSNEPRQSEQNIDEPMEVVNQNINSNENEVESSTGLTQLVKQVAINAEENVEEEEDVEEEEEVLPEETMIDSCEGIRFAPGEGNSPIPIFMDPHCKEMFFPTIWGGTKQKTSNVKLHFNERLKSEILRADIRCRRSDYLLCMEKICQLHQLNNQVNVVLRKTSQETGVTAGQALDNQFVQSIIAKDGAYSIGATIPGNHQPDKINFYFLFQHS